jgi:ferric-dicitrate binding protein FerR (iron transport regulator)
MEKYLKYSAKDFVDDSRFRSWVRHPSSEEDLIWYNWISNHPDQEPAIKEARALILAIHPVHDDTISEAELNVEIAGIMAHIGEEEIQNTSFAPMPRRTPRLFWLAAAASVIIVVVAGWYGRQYFGVRQSGITSDEGAVSFPDNYMIERINKGDDALLISLPDNSSVLLSRNSLVRYPRQFAGDSRNIFLEGTAFFEVTKDANKPFYVNAGKLIAKVLGTSFEITSNQSDGQVSVVVKSGTVSIYANGDSDDQNKDREPNVILTEHEQFIFRDEVSQIQHTRLDPVSIEELKVPDTYLKFTATPATEVLKSLAQVYGVHIDFTNADITGCSVTASFTDEPFPLKLALICRSIGVEYQIINDRVTIKGTGCKN